jgi:hypothetical protein
MKKSFFAIGLLMFVCTAIGVSAQQTLSTSTSSSAGAGQERPAAHSGRAEAILSVAKRLKFRNPELALGIVPESVADESEIESILRRAAEIEPSLVQAGTFCEPGFVGDPISFSSSVTLKMDDLLTQIHRRF